MKRVLLPVLAVLLLAMAAIAHAACIISEPLFAAFVHGYGAVAVTVVSTAPSGEEYCTDVGCKVAKVIAQPVVGEKLPLKETDEIHVLLCDRHYGDISNHEIVKGDKYILTLKYDPDKKAFTEITGSYSVKVVKDFDAITLHAITVIHDLAAAPAPDCFALARKALVDPQATLEMRESARSVLSKVADPKVPQAERDMTIAALRQQWAHLTPTQGLQGMDSVREGSYDVRGVDDALTALDRDFKSDSDVRINGWLNIIFTPFEAKDLDKSERAGWDMAQRWNAYLRGVLPEIGLSCPDKVAPRIIKEMNDPKWPDEFRLGLAGALQTMYQEAEQPKAVWEVELQHFYPAALGYAEPGTVRLLATLIEQGLAEPSENGTKRKFIAKQETWDAMRGCIWRLRLVKDDPYQEAPATIHELQDLLEAYKPHQSATTSPSSASN